MPVYVIDTLKPKNGLDFPVVEAEDVAVSDELRLPEALGQKAEQTDLEELSVDLANKANSSDVAIADANLQAQIDNLITPVTQDAEVQNARVGAGGQSYTTLKARLDTDNTVTSSDINVVASQVGAAYLPAMSTFVRGRLTAGSVYTDFKYRVTAENIMHADQPILFSVKSGFKFGIAKYDAEGNYIASSDVGWLTEGSVDKGDYFRISIARTSEDTLEIANINLFVSEVITSRSVSINDELISARKDSNNTVFATLNDRLTSDNAALSSRISETKEDVGVVHLADLSTFIRGRITAGIVYTDFQYRVVSENIIHANQSMAFTANTGFKFGFSYYDSEGNYIEDTVWLTEGVINANENFRIVIAREEETSEIADINYFVSQVSSGRVISINAELVSARVDNNNIVFPTLNARLLSDKAAILNELSEIKSDLGIIVLSDLSTFIRGRITAGTIYTDYKWRVCPESIIHAEQNMHFASIEGFKFGFSYYTSDGTYINDTPWMTEGTIKSGQYFRIVIARVEEDRSETADINEFVSAIEVSTNKTSYQYSFTGELNTKVKQYNADRMPFTTPAIASHTRQGVAYYGGVIFQFYADNMVGLIDYETGETIATLSAASEHADCVGFSNEFYDVEDEFPLCYVSTDENPAKVNVIRISRTETELIRTLTFPLEETGYYAGHILDNLNNLIYMIGYKTNSYTSPVNNSTIIAAYRLDSLTANQDNSYTPELVKQYGYVPFIYCMQGMEFFDNKFCICSGSNDIAKKSKVYFVSVETGSILSIMEDLPDEVKDTELEGAFFKKNDTSYSMVLSLQNGRLYEITFK